MNAFRIELLRSPARYSALLVASLCWVVFWSLKSKDLSVWTEADVSTGYVFVLVGPLVAATGAWVAARDRRIDWEEVLSTGSRTRDGRLLLTFAGTWVLLVVGYLVGVIAVYADTARGATWGGPSLLLVAANVAYLTVVLAIGVLVGTLVSWRVAPIALAVAVYWVQFWLTLSDGTARLMPVDDNVLFGATPAAGLALERVALWFLLAVGVGGIMFVVCRQGRRRLWGLLPAVAALGVLTVAPAHIASAASADVEDVALVCTSTAVEVCVHPAFSAIGDAVAASLNEALQPVRHAGVGPVRAEQTFGRGRLEGDTLEFNLARADNRFLGAGLDISADMAVAKLFYTDGACEGPGSGPSNVARGGLMKHLTGYDEGNKRASAFSRKLERMSVPERTEWLRANWAGLLDCTVPRSAIN